MFIDTTSHHMYMWSVCACMQCRLSLPLNRRALRRFKCWMLCILNTCKGAWPTMGLLKHYTMCLALIFSYQSVQWPSTQCAYCFTYRSLTTLEQLFNSNQHMVTRELIFSLHPSVQWPLQHKQEYAYFFIYRSLTTVQQLLSSNQHMNMRKYFYTFALILSLHPSVH